MTPKLGYLCLFENPSAEVARALIRQFVLIREADRMGFDHIWLAEHHGDPVWPSGAITALLGHAAGVTSHAKIGPLAMTPLRRDPLALAEDLATIDLLSKGRLQLGVSQGTPFEKKPVSETALLECLQALLARLAGQVLPSDQPDAMGQATAAAHVYPTPTAQQVSMPVWMATTQDRMIRSAAEQGWGLVLSATASRQRLQRVRRVYREVQPNGDPALLLVRFAMTASSQGEAADSAMPYLRTFADRMAALGVGGSSPESLALQPEALLAESLVGSFEDVAQQIRGWVDDEGVTDIAIVPTSSQFDTVKHCLAHFVDEIRPLLDDD